MRTARTPVVFLVLALAFPAAASANDFQTVYREYKRTGTIKPCKFSDKQLANAEKQTPPDVEQYAPSFLDALQSARERNADCHKAAAPAPAAAPTASTPTATPTPSTPTPAPSSAPAVTTAAPAPAAAPPAPTVPAQAAVKGVASPPVAHPKKDDSAPAAVWLLAVIAGLVLLSALFAASAWWFGWSGDRFTRPWRASWGDYSGRLADLGIELRDWLRTGV